MDLRAVNGALPQQAHGVHLPTAPASTQLMAIGSEIAAEARRAVKLETGYRTSAGISCNKLLAKLISGLHKPEDQTVMLPQHGASFLGPLPVRAVPGGSLIASSTPACWASGRDVSCGSRTLDEQAVQQAGPCRTTPPFMLILVAGASCTNHHRL